MRSQMDAIKINNKIDMSEVDLIIHIVLNLPKEYKVFIAGLEQELQDTSKLFILNKLGAGWTANVNKSRRIQK